MSCKICCVACLAMIAPAYAQTPKPAEVHLVGDRFKPLEYAEMTPAQQTLIQHALTGERHSAAGIFNILLRSPEMGDALQEFGAYGRFHSELPPKVRELVVIMTARYVNGQFEWNAHKRAALQAGVSPQIVDAIAHGERPESMDQDEEAAYGFMSELLVGKQVSDGSFDKAKQQFGEKGIVNMIALSGFYQISSMLLNVDRYPLPAGAQPELKALPQPLP